MLLPASTSSAPHRSLQRLWQMFSPKAWKPRVVFWLGALSVGAVAALFAEASERANSAFHMLSSSSKWLPFLVS